MAQKYYITTPIYYVNGAPHIGHAYTSVICDVIARFKRLDGFDVKFLTGTDEHGQKIEKAAASAGLNPKNFTDMVSAKFVELGVLLNLSNTDFIRTTEQRHIDFVKMIWKRLKDEGHIYLGNYAGWYAERDEAFYSESELVDGRAPTGAAVEWVEEPSYFFNLSSWQDRLLSLYESNPNFIAPESRRNEIISFVKSGLLDLSISRTKFSWGIGVPDEEEHLIYVWLDALFNYISALGSENSKYWPCDLHIVGKDILRFHAVYWPAFLMACDIDLPKKIFAHGWWTNEGEKISKSLGNVIDPIALIKEFDEDFLRYFLIKEVPLGNDGNYVRTNFINRINAELVNNIGNLIHRVFSLIYKNCNAQIPMPGDLRDEDLSILDRAYTAVEQMRALIDMQALHSALEVIVQLATSANIYIDRQAPWILQKNDVVRMNTVLYILAESIRVIVLLLQPFIPNATQRLIQYMQLAQNDFQSLGKNFALRPGTKIEKPVAIFSRI